MGMVMSGTVILVECFPAGQGGSRDNGHDAGPQRSCQFRHLRRVQPRFSRPARQPPVPALGVGVLGVRHVGKGLSADREVLLLVVMRTRRPAVESRGHQRH